MQTNSSGGEGFAAGFFTWATIVVVAAVLFVLTADLSPKQQPIRQDQTSVPTVVVSGPSQHAAS